MEQPIIANGGVQCVPQIAAVQYVYLDFDGELTSYNGEILTVDHVEVQNSSLTEERIANIVAELNAKYAAQNVIFVTQHPETAEYSTIFIGKTDAFAPYGNFAGLAETIDDGNEIKTDKAFVMLDSTDSNEAIISIISHETDHLLGTLNHGGEGLQAYAAHTIIGNGVTSTGLIITSGNSITIANGGVANNTTVDYRGHMHISSGGMANRTSTTSYGYISVFNGGIANKTTLYWGAGMYILSGGVADDTTVNSDGAMYISSGGVANSTTVNSRGSMYISSGGTATDITALSGARLDITVAPDTYIQGTYNGSAFEMKDARISGYTVTPGCYMYISNGGTANSTTVNYGGSMCISSGGVANDTTVYDGGGMLISSGGVANSTTVNRGRMYIASGGVANSPTVNSGGSITIFSGGTATNIRVSSRGGLYITIASDTYIQGTSNGSAFEMKDAQISGYTVDFLGNMTIFAGGVANSTTVNYGYMHISSGGVANSTAVGYNGWMYISSGGTATNVNWTPCVGHVAYAVGASVTFAANLRGVYWGAGGRLSAHANIMTGKLVSDLHCMYVMAGGTARNTTVGAPFNNGSERGCIYVYSGGIADITIVSSDSEMTIYGDGTANNTTVNSYGTMYISGGTANSTTVNSYGTMYISGGTANSTTVNSNGYMKIFSGGVANSTTVNSYGTMYISGGTANSTTVNSDGYMKIFSGGVANSTTVNSYGTMYISGGTVNSTTVGCNGKMYISSGVASNIMVNSGGYISIRHDGVAKSTTVNNGGYMCILSGASVTALTLSAGGQLGGFSFAEDKYFENITGGSAFVADNVYIIDSYMFISSGGVANSTTVNSSGYMFISSGGVANSTTVNSGGYMSISSGVANSTTVNYGYMRISSGGVANSTTVNSWGSMYIFSGGVANSTTVNYGYMSISSGVANSTTIKSGCSMYIHRGGTHSGYLQIESGATVSAYYGSIIDFTVSGRSTADGYLINNLLLISGAPTYTITVSASQAVGTYKLAQGASSFTGTISIGDGTTNYGSITVNGSDLVYGGKSYSLDQVGGNLTLTIGAYDVTPPAKPTASANITALTNQNVIVTATFSSDTAVKQYSLNNSNWYSYTSGITMSANGSVYFRGQDAAGNISEVTTYTVNNIDKTLPTINNVSLSQGTSNYTFTATVTASDNKTAAANLKYQIKYATTQSGLTTATATSGKSFTLANTAAGKTYYYQVGVTDEAGNTAWSSNTNTFTVKDVTAPSISSVSIAQGAGNYIFTATVSASDNKTAAANLKYQIKYATTQSGLTTATATSGKSFTLNANAAGKTYYYQIGVTDEAGNTTWSSNTNTFTVKDVTAPSISSVSIAQGAGNYIFTATVSASDNKTAAANLKYQIKYATTQSGLTTATATSGKSFTLANTAAGKTYYYQVGVTDEAGNTAWSDVKNTAVKDVTAPTLNGTPTAAVNGQSVTISWNAASDNLAVKGYYLTVDGNKYSVTGNSYTLNNLAVGNHTFTLSAYDAAGNESSKSASKSFTIAEPADTVKPTISSVSIAQGAGNYTFTATVIASDNKTATANLSYQIKWATSQSGLTTATATSGKSFTLTNTAAGQTYYYQVGVTDEAGNTAWSDVKNTAVKDVTAPTLNGTPTAAANGQSVTISWNAASDNVGIAGYCLTVDGTEYTVSGTSYTLIDLSVGNHTFTLSAYDAAGNESSKSASKSFTIAEPADTVKPTISSVSIAQGAGNYTFTATVIASDNKTATANLAYQIKYATSTSDLTTATATSGKSFMLNANAAGKTYYYQVGVTDEAGNTAWSDVKNTAVKDVTAPTLNGTPTAAVNGQSVTISWNAASDNLAVKGYYLTVDGNKYTVTGKTSYTLSNLAVGNHTFTLSAYDAAGNESSKSASKSFTIAEPADTVKPTISSVSIAQGAGNYTFTATVSAFDNKTAAANLTYQIKYATSTSGLNTATATSGKSFTLNANTAGQTYYYQVGVTDEAGNTAWSSVKSIAVKDVTAPSISSVSIAQGAGNYTFTATVSASDNKTAAANLKYQIKYATSTSDLTTATATSGKSFMLNANAAGKTYYYQVGVTDGAGNTTWSTAKSTTVKDVTKPTLNGTPTAAVNGQSVTISWNAASDNLEVKGYYLTVDGNKYNVTGKTSYTLSNLAVGNHTFTLSAYDAAGNESSKSASKSFTIAEPADTVKPTISSVSIAQGAGNYTFTATVSAFDNKTAAANLTYQIKYATSTSGLNTATATSGKSFMLNANAAGKTYYYQVGVTDEAGNTTWSTAKSTTVKDVTAPTLNGTATAAVNGQNVTISWNSAADNVGIAKYELRYTAKHGSAKPNFDNAKVYSTTNTTFTLSNLSSGDYYYQVSAVDAAGNRSAWSNFKSFTVNASAPEPETIGSTFKWSGTEYVYVQENGVTKSDFVWNDSWKCYTCTNNDIVDAEKDSENIANYYLYKGTCWAATASNMFVRAGWSDGISSFSSEDNVLRYFVDNFTKKNDSGYPSVSGSTAEFGVEYLLGGYYDYLQKRYPSWPRPITVYTGGFYENVTKGNMDEYLSSYAIFIDHENRTISHKQYITETGGYAPASFTGISFTEQAFERLKSGYVVGLSVSFYDDSYSINGGGHAITVYGFTYDESKKGTSGYLTGIIVADSDDDKGTKYNPNGFPASFSPNTIKILDMEYSDILGTYILPDYNSYVTIEYENQLYSIKCHAVIDGFQYLAQRPDNITYSLNSGVGFAKNADWNAAYSVSISEADALNGNPENKRITAADDIYIAVNLSNSGLGDSDSFTITAVIDEDVENALTFNISKILSYGESDDQTVINLGKLAKGIHNIELTVTDGDITNTINISNLYVAYANLSDNKFTVNAGQSYNGSNITADQSLIIMGNASANGTVITANGEQVVKANGSAEQSKIYANGMLTVENGGSANKAEVFEQGFLIANGNVNETTVHAGGALFADQNSKVQDTLIEADGWMDINYQGSAADTDVYGNLMVTNGTAEDTTVFGGGTFMVVDNGVSDGANIQNNAKQYVADGGNASNNTFTGALSEQYVFAEGSVATGNTFDAGAQIVASGGLVNDNTFNNGGVQDLSEGATAVNTVLNGGSIQYIWKAVAYDTTVNADCMAFVLENGISVNCTVKSEGYIILGDLEMFEEDKGVGAVKDLTVEYGGYAMLEEGAVLYGTTTVAGSLAISGDITGSTMTQQDASPIMVFDFSDRTATDGYMVSNISLISDLTFDLMFDDAQVNGTYKLAANGGADFSDAISIYDDEGVYYGALTLNDVVLMGDQIVTLENLNGALTLVVADSPYSAFEIPEAQIQTQDSSCSWGHIANSESYIIQFSRDNFQTFVSVEMSENALTLNNLPYDLQWRVRAKESNVWTNGENIKANAEAGDNVVHASKDWEFDVLFASTSGKWTSGYAAQHTGILEYWSGTNEQVTLTGKNKLADIFEGSSDANILLLTDDVNGDALFVDDIYTALPGTVAEQQARIAKIDEIRAGAGDDIVDMTSQQFDYVGDGVKVYGGLGNDTIWANNGNNALFGDAGDDRIIGGANNDVLVGSSGNDSMHGGGGEDIFCFGGDWGTDTVEQLANGSVTLWFEEGSESNWDASALTYTDGTNSVKVSGVSAGNITLRFGDNGSLLYDELSASGCFDDAASEKIFEDKNKGMLA